MVGETRIIGGRRSPTVGRPLPPVTVAGISSATARSSRSRVAGGASAIAFRRPTARSAGAARILERHHRQLRRRRHALGDVAVVRGERARGGLGVRSGRTATPSALRRDGGVPPRGVRRSPEAHVVLYLTEDEEDGLFYRFARLLARPRRGHAGSAARRRHRDPLARRPRSECNGDVDATPSA